MNDAAKTEDQRLLPISAGEFYSLRATMARVADEMRLAAACGVAIGPIEAEEWWIDVTKAVSQLDKAWNSRQANLRVVK